MFEDIKELLNLRRVPQAHEDLSARIIDAAAGLSQEPLRVVRKDRSSLWGELQNFFTLPQPAFAMAITLLLGLMIGLMSDSSLLLPGLTTNELAAFMEINDGFVAGEWL